MIEQMKHIPSWLILLILFVCLMIGYYIRPDNVTEDALKSVIGALLLSMRSTQPPNPQV